MPKLNRRKLSESFCKSLKFVGSNRTPQYVWDSEVPGLGLRVYPTDTKTWVIWYRVNLSSSRFKKIGPYGVYNVESARKRARALLASTHDGIDPFEIRSAQTKFSELCESYISEIKRTNKSWNTDARRLSKHFIPLWGDLSIEIISHTKVSKWFNEYSALHPYEANRCVVLLKSLYNYAHRMKWTESHNPTTGIRLNPESARERIVPLKDLPKLLRVIRAQEPPYRQALLLYFYTGARKHEILNLKWSDISFESLIITFRDTKNKKNHKLPISSPALEVLQELKSIYPNHKFLFPSPVYPEKAIRDLRHVWNRIRSDVGLEDITLHDLRRTVGYLLANDAQPLTLVQNILNHSSSTTTAQHYSPTLSDDVRDALERLGKRIARF